MHPKSPQTPVTQDLSLVDRFLAGDRETQRRLHDQVEHLLEKAISVLEHRGVYFRDREEVKQGILVNILVDNDARVLRNFRGQSRLATYLWSTIRFRLIDRLRQETLAASRTAPLDRDIPQAEPESGGELADLVERFLSHVSEQEAFVLRLRWLDGLNYKAICHTAEEQGTPVTPAFIGNLLFRMRKNLLEYLKRHGYSIDKQVKGTTGRSGTVKRAAP